MDVKKYRAKSLQEALALVRRELGPEASVLRTREVRGGLLRWITNGPSIEVLASSSVAVPSRLPPKRRAPAAPTDATDQAQNYELESALSVAMAAPAENSATLAPVVPSPAEHWRSGLDSLSRRATARRNPLPEALFALYTDLIEADLTESLARQWVDRIGQETADLSSCDPRQLKALLARLVADDIPVTGPIRVTPGKRRLVALVGPTGVGKTTTIAKLAANFRLREKHRVGLITVDTYRIAAVEQLRTYADIIDLPMEIVATPREMRQAVSRLADLDLILMDTAGRSPRDELKIQELRALLTEAEPHEVHLVLSTVAGGSALAHAAEQFAAVGATALLLTKLDEAGALGNLPRLFEACNLPLSYLTHGQKVPDDIAAADSRQLAESILGL